MRFGLKLRMKRKGIYNRRAKKTISIVLLLAFAFVFICATGIVNCPKSIFLDKVVSQSVIDPVVFPCHQTSEEGKPETQSDVCQCLEVSKAEDSSNQLEFVNLLRLSQAFIVLVPTLDLNSDSSVFQTNHHLSFVLQSHTQIHQKTIKLLI
jgi:hypothetical protein